MATNVLNATTPIASVGSAKSTVRPRIAPKATTHARSKLEVPVSTRDPIDAITVVLVNVPMQFYGRWQQHAEALLREYLLATIDDSDPEAQLRLHSQCSDAVALLAEALPAARPAATDGDPGHDVRTATLELTVPRESIPHYATLDETLDVALSLADSDQLLTPSTDTEMRRFRGWICREVARQAAGQPPLPWNRG